FQAEDGIRDLIVTGVQTCALPIYVVGTDPAEDVRLFGEGRDATDFPSLLSISDDGAWTVLTVSQGWVRSAVFLRRGQGPFEPIRSEERRVGKEGREWWGV